MLNALKNKGFRLIFLSNCKIEYMEANRKLFDLGQYFSDFYCTEAYDFKPKHGIFKIIKEKYEGSFIVIGDRLADIEIATIHGLYSIGCGYGFGSKQELAKANAIAGNVLDILNLIPLL